MESEREFKRIGVYGGTFDPVHNGHVEIALQAQKQFELDRLLIVPNNIPPHKEGQTTAPWKDRFQMLELAFAGQPGIEVSSLEQRGGRSYTFDTLRSLQKLATSEDQLFFVIGADAFAEVTTWHRWQDVLKMAEFIVVSRPGSHYQLPPGARVHPLNGLSMDVSSSGIRRQCREGKSPEGLPAAVKTHIQNFGLYRIP
jgi:nicotinate-nucleotide adenylyltransferase